MMNRNAPGFNFDGDGTIRCKIGVSDRTGETTVLVMIVGWSLMGAGNDH